MLTPQRPLLLAPLIFLVLAEMAGAAPGGVRGSKADSVGAGGVVNATGSIGRPRSGRAAWGAVTQRAIAQQRERRAQRLAKLKRHLAAVAGGNGSSPFQVPTGKPSAVAGVAGAAAGGAGVAPEVQAIYDLLNDAGGYGALVHNMYSSLVHEIVDRSLEHDNVIPWVYQGEIGPVNDCHSDEKPYCSAWALLHRSVLPIVYNYPAMAGMANGQHQVGLLVGAQALAEAKDTTMYVVDGDSWNRYVGGIDKDDVWLKQDVSDDGHDPEDSAVTYRCWANDPSTSCGQDADTCQWPYCYEDALGSYSCGAHVGENGERWAAMFMNNGLSKEDAMLRQCPWEGLPDAQIRQAYTGAMNGFYDAALSLQAAGQLSGLPDGGMYMDSEVDMDIGTGGEDLGWFEDMIQAVVVQDNRCDQQIPGRAECSDSTWYPQGDEEEQVWDSFLAACRLSDVLYRKQGRNVPVIAGRFLSNAVVVPDEWEGFRNGGDFFANDQWMADFTWYCCSDQILMGEAPWHYSCF